MNRLLIIFTAVVSLTIPTLSAATPPRQGPYISGFFGTCILGDADVSSYDYWTGDSYADRAEFAPDINIGGTVGFDYGAVRLEGELSYKQGEMATITDRVNNVQFHGESGNLGALAMMFNTFFDLHNSSPVTPYLGGGVGFAAIHLSDTYVAEFGPPIYQEGDDSVFAYQIGAGFEIALKQRLSLDFGYRYFAATKASFDSYQDIASELKFKSHNVAVGLRALF
ncbi:MAG: outer membrane beta-barrel protein [Desulfuromonadaceae bacterium]|nr:outer membrane beta-barrel protein [Desulfuromonadaceae bacterium]